MELKQCYNDDDDDNFPICYGNENSNNVGVNIDLKTRPYTSMSKVRVSLRCRWISVITLLGLFAYYKNINNIYSSVNFVIKEMN